MRITAGLVLAAFLGACTDHAPVAELDVVITAADTAFALGESIPLRIVAHNTSTTPQAVERSQCSRPFRVVSQFGTELWLPPVICTLQGVPPVALQPGDSVVFTSSWDGRMRDETGALVFAAPGYYQLFGRVWVPTEISSPADWIRLKPEIGVDGPA